MAQTIPSLSVIQCSHDAAWMHAFQQGLQQFGFVNLIICNAPDELPKLLANHQVDLIVWRIGEVFSALEGVTNMLKKASRPIPVLVVTPKCEVTDTWIQQGADWVVARQDILSAIHITRKLIQSAELSRKVQSVMNSYRALEDRHNKILEDLPNPLCCLHDGLFLAANPAFLRQFQIKDRAKLDEVTMMNFVPAESKYDIKQLLKQTGEKNVVVSDHMVFQDNNGDKFEMRVQASSVMVNGETAIQLYFHPKSEGNLRNREDISIGLEDKSAWWAQIHRMQTSNDEQSLGLWVYLWVENYREIFLKDDYKTAEMFMQAVVKMTQQNLPSSTGITRFSDDTLLLWMQGDKAQNAQQIRNLIAQLDGLIPEDIGRLVRPNAFAGILELRQDSDFESMLSKSYRAVRELLSGQSQARISEPNSVEMSAKDTRRVQIINQWIDNHRLKFLYQPITKLEADGVARYADKLSVLPDETGGYEEKEIINVEKLSIVARRFNLGRKIDRVKIEQFCQDILSYADNQQNLYVFLAISTDALVDERFPEWVETQLQQTSVSPAQIVFEFRLEVAYSAFSGILRFIERLRPQGSQFAVSGIGRFDAEIEALFTRIKPNIIKLDIGKIDTFDDKEELQFMQAITTYAKMHNIMLIAEQMQSAAQLSRVWPYDIQYLQGDGIAPAMERFNFDFNSPLF